MREVDVRITRVVAVLCVAIVMPACASLEGLRALVQPPKFSETDRPAEIRLAGPSADRPFGGATVRLWTEVSNPNPFGFTLGTLDGTLFLEGTRAADAAFPLGLPLDAGQTSVIPIELSISFSDLASLSDVVRRAARRESVEYRLEGTIGVDAGRLGQPVFGPMTLVRGDFRSR
jgi:Late embryogenesis abundant protein